MRCRPNRLLMLLLASALTACSTQSERGSTGTESQAPAAAAPQPDYAPEREGVQYSDAPLPATPPAPPAKVEQPVEEFPITRYELPAEEEEVQDLGPLDTDEETASYDEDPTPERDLGVSEPTEEQEEEHVVEDLGPVEQDEATAAYEEEQTPERDLGVSEPMEEQEEEHVVEDLGPVEQDEATAAYEEEQTPERDLGVSEPMEEQEEEHVVEDLGPMEESGPTASFAEDQTPQRDLGVSQPQEFADEPVAQAPATPPRQAPQQLTLDFEAEADPLFNFDRASIRSDQRAKLDQLVSELNGASYDSISVTGHADRIGTERYNEQLSQRRANAVKAYLVRKGVPASKIQVSAMGESQPVTTDEDCRGERGRALIACYQPDRRVEVSVAGEKKQ